MVKHCVLTFILLSAQVTSAQTLPKFFTIEGRFFKDGDPINQAVDVQLEILDPSANCVLYRETHTNVNVSSSDPSAQGVFALQLGSSSTPDFVNVPVSRLFSNGTAINGDGCLYNPVAYNDRKVRISVRLSVDGPGGAFSAISPNTTISAVPSAMVADSLQGFYPVDFMQVSGTSTQARLDDILTTNYSAITDLAAGTSSQYLRYTSDGTQVPSLASDPMSPIAGQMWYDSTSGTLEYYDGTSTISLSASGVDSTKITDADNDTKIQVSESTDEDKIRFDTSGSERMIIDTNGNVGIGSNAPSALLDVAGPIRTAGSAGGIMIARQSDSADVWQWYSPGGDLELYDQVANLNRMIISNTGNVAIGNSMPNVSLDIREKSDAIHLPSGTDGERPGAADGMLRYNITNNKFEGYENGSWVNLRDPAIGVNFVAATGTAAAPSISFTGEQDTGFYNSGSNAIGLSAGGVQIFTFNPVGLVSPTTGGGNILSGSGTFSAPTYSFAGDTDTGWFRPAINSMAASTAGVERMRIDSSGKIIVNGASPNGPLNVAGTTYLNGAMPLVALHSGPTKIIIRDVITPTLGTHFALIDFQTDATTTASITAVATDNHSTSRGTALSFSTIANGSSDLLEKMRIDHNGDVGIGTDNPEAKLHVQGDAKVTGSLSVGYERVQVNLTAGTTVSATCTGAKKIVGGGCSGRDSNNVPAASYPSSDTTWTCDFHLAPTGASAYAICMNVTN